MTLDLDHLHLSQGSHRPDGEACVMEAVSQAAGEPWSDHPKSTDPSLGAYLRTINDRSPQWVRDELAKRVPAIAKARQLPENWRYVWAEAARQSAIRALGPELGKALASLPAITDRESAAAPSAAAADAAARSAAAWSAAAAAARSAADAADAAAGGVSKEWVYALDLIDRAIAEAHE